MIDVTFVTGNEHKVNLLSGYMGKKFKHTMIELDEIQSMSLHEVAEHKVRQAYDIIKSPVLVEDVGVYIKALNGLPGPFIKWFWQALSLQGVCRLMDSYEDRSVSAHITFAYFDGNEVIFFDGKIDGHISDKPRGEGFGWNPIFITEGSSKTLAELQDDNDLKHSLRATTVYPKIKMFLDELDKMN